MTKSTLDELITAIDPILKRFPKTEADRLALHAERDHVFAKHGWILEEFIDALNARLDSHDESVRSK